MRAMVLHQAGMPLKDEVVADPLPGFGQVLVKVAACGVCRTDLHVVDGDLSEPKLPIIPGHEIVGRIAALGPGVSRFRPGDRVGIPWLGHTCGHCNYCRGGAEICAMCRGLPATTIDGGYAEYALAEAAYCFALPMPPLFLRRWAPCCRSRRPRCARAGPSCSAVST
jgi:alcohol dehydrogenase, propanol-preferring